MAVDDVVPCGLSADDLVLGMRVVLGVIITEVETIAEPELGSEFEIIADVLLANVEVVKPDTPPPRTDRRMSPTNPSRPRKPHYRYCIRLARLEEY